MAQQRREKRKRKYVLWAIAVLAVATVILLVMFLIQRRTAQLLFIDPSQIFSSNLAQVSPEGRTIHKLGRTHQLLVPVQLYPGSRIEGFWVRPTGDDTEMGMFLVLSTFDGIGVVKEYYVRQWRNYEVNVGESTMARTLGTDGWSITTSKIAGKIASMDILRVAADKPHSLRDGWTFKPLQPGEKTKTEIDFLVPIIRDEGRTR